MLTPWRRISPQKEFLRPVLETTPQDLQGVVEFSIYGPVAGTSIAFAGESAYARMLHQVLGEENIHVGQLIIPNAITEGHETHDPQVLAEKLWKLHIERQEFRIFAEPMDL